MIISKKTMNDLHNIQVDMLKSLIEVMNKLDIQYFFVHGSLLGACSINDFIIEDDDIDIAIFRNDYERLLNDGNKLLPKELFIQSSLNDGFPLPFAKLRNNETAFIQPSLQKYNCNQGIYIDIFPIDYANKSLLFRTKFKLMNVRINAKMPVHKSFCYRIIECFSKIMYPSIRKTMEKRDKLLKRQKESNCISIYGGKLSERNMQLSWFSDITELKFCNILVKCPKGYHEYLRCIYGNNYLKHNPADGRFDDNGIEISASVLDFRKSYKEYLKIDYYK